MPILYVAGWKSDALPFYSLDWPVSERHGRGSRYDWQNDRMFVCAALHGADERSHVMHLGDGRIALLSGYAGDEDVSGFLKRNLFLDGEILKLRKELGGIYSLLLVDPQREEIRAWSSQPAIEGIYFDIRAKAISNRPGLLARSARGSNQGYLSWYLGPGYSLDNSTPFASVSTVPSDNSLFCTAKAISLRPHPNPPIEHFTELTVHEASEMGEATLLECCIPLLRFSDVELFLSDGKDSRLLCAALAKSGMTVKTSTRDVPEGGILQVAEKISGLAGFTNSLMPIGANSTDPLCQVSHVLKSSFGHPNTEANVDFGHWPVSSGPSGAVIFGHAHLQKGGFIRRMLRSPEEVRSTLLEKFDNPLAAQGVRQAVRDSIIEWQEAHEFPEKVGPLFWANHDFRVARYLRAHFYRFSSKSNPVYPLVDERWARLCAALPKNYLANESFMYLVMNRLYPKLSELPPVEKRWRFESGSASDIHPETHDLRAAVQVKESPRSKRPNAWSDSNLHQTLAKRVLDSSHRENIMECVTPQMQSTLASIAQGTRPEIENVPRRLVTVQLFRMAEASVLYDEVLPYFENQSR
jgi:hypothetical protein